MKLSIKQELFCNEYLTDLNGCQAAIRAGYSKKTAQEQSSRLLSTVKVQKRLSELMKSRSDKTKITNERVLIEIARIAFNDPRRAFDQNGNLLPIKDWPEDVAAAISSIKINETKIAGSDDGVITTKEIKFWSKDKQLELAGKHLGMFIEKIQHSGQVEFDPIPKFDSPEAFIEWQKSQDNNDNH